MHRIYIHRGHPHSTYAQKSPKLDPLPPLCAIVRIWLDPSPSPLCVRTMWINNNLLITNKNKKFINLSQNQKVFVSKTGQPVNMSFKH